MRMSYIGHLWIPVSNLAKSLEFYIEKLGLMVELSVEPDDDIIGEDLKNPFAQLKTRDNKTSVILIQEPRAVNKMPGVIAGWVVNNLAAVYKSLKKAGVEFMGEIQDFGERKFIHFKDIDGNVFHLTELVKSKNKS